MILRTKLTPPKPQRYTLVRPRVEARLREAINHRVAILHAGTGCGKSTALAQLAESGAPVFWYSASEEDSDPQLFLAHLAAAFRSAAGESAILDGRVDVGAVNLLLNTLNDSLTTDSLFVIDDFHLAASPDVNALLDHFLAYLPNQLHVIISSRHAPTLEHSIAWRARGQLLEIKREELAFTQEEIAALFHETYALPLSPRDVEVLEERTEGWPIALQLVWQEMRANPKRDVAALLAQGSGSLDTLFAFLARDILSHQPREIHDFLLQTAVLRELTPAACQAVTAHPNSRELLARLSERDLFIASLGDEHYRYHHLFHDFLRAQLAREKSEAACAQHRRAAEFFSRTKNPEDTLYHFLRAKDYTDAANLIEEIGENIMRSGRLDTLAGWIAELPPDTLETHPLLIFYLGDLARLHSRFDDALAWYAQAERAWRAANDPRGISRALRGQALVYLDTVRPARAEDLLQEALRITDGLEDRAARARLFELIAENKLNMGQPDEAEQLRLQARTLREEGPSEDVLSVRVKLRTGKLDEARAILENWAQAERGQIHPPRAHRETLLILSLIHSLQGNAEEAFRTAEEGTTLGAQFQSPFISAVGQMRLGHAHQVRGDLRAAIQCYEKAIALGDQLAVQRTRAEAMMGLTRAYGFGGDLSSARRSAAEGIEIGANAGDAWIVALVQLALGASQVFAHRERDAIESLTDALAAMHSCGDTFGSAVARMWLARAFWNLGKRDRALAHLDQTLGLAQTHQYDFLLTTRTLSGWDDARLIVPLLLEARRRRTRHAAFAARLLSEMGLENVAAHPGYQLRVQTLGAFRVWRGKVEVGAREWQRKKARRLFQLFITERRRMIEREEIFELLWRGESLETATREFKVALNALNKALEPDRAADAEPAFIARADSAYGLRAGADIWIDADEFMNQIARAEKSSHESAISGYRLALALYHDDFLVDARYEEWATAERERLLATYLRAADRLAEELFLCQDDDECIAWCEKILQRDRCWEHAYRLMMGVHVRRRDDAQARRVYERCVHALREDLDAEPSPAMRELIIAQTSDV